MAQGLTFNFPDGEIIIRSLSTEVTNLLAQLTQMKLKAQSILTTLNGIPNRPNVSALFSAIQTDLANPDNSTYGPVQVAKEYKLGVESKITDAATRATAVVTALADFPDVNSQNPVIV